MHIFIPFEPVACSRPRVTRYGTYYSAPYKTFKKAVTDYLKKNYLAGMFKDSLLTIEYLFIMPRPKSLYRKKDCDGRIHHSKKPDLDNLIKSINDVLQLSNIIEDDSKIYQVSACKQIAAKDEKAHIKLKITVCGGKDE